MYQSFDRKRNKPLVNILPGEYTASGEDVIIQTILGSCVAVVLFDRTTGIGGMNHFMLAEPLRKDTTAVEALTQTESGKYGVNAMELLVNAMLKSGAQRRQLRAKLFGGGSVFASEHGITARIPASNIQLAKTFLKNESITIDSEDTGGNRGRKVLFMVKTTEVLVKLVGREPVEQREQDYLERIKRRTARRDITLFD